MPKKITQEEFLAGYRRIYNCGQLRMVKPL